MFRGQCLGIACIHCHWQLVPGFFSVDKTKKSVTLCQIFMDLPWYIQYRLILPGFCYNLFLVSVFFLHWKPYKNTDHFICFLTKYLRVYHLRWHYSPQCLRVRSLVVASVGGSACPCWSHRQGFGWISKTFSASFRVSSWPLCCLQNTVLSYLLCQWFDT